MKIIGNSSSEPLRHCHRIGIVHGDRGRSAEGNGRSAAKQQSRKKRRRNNRFHRACSRLAGVRMLHSDGTTMTEER